MDTQNRITGMIEERIRNDVAPAAEAVAGALHKQLEAELESLGVHHFTTCMHQFVREVRDQYREKLVNDRFAALVDKLVAPAHATSVNAIEAVAEPMVMPKDMAEQVRKMIAEEQAGLLDKLQRAGRI